MKRMILLLLSLALVCGAARGEALPAEAAPDAEAVVETLDSADAATEGFPDAEAIEVEPASLPAEGAAEANAAVAPIWSIELGPGQARSLGRIAGMRGGLRFASSKKRVATVSAKGVVRGRRPGRAKITVRDGAGGRVVIDVRVMRKAAKGVILGGVPEGGALRVGESVRLTAAVRPRKASQRVGWSVGDDAVATVSPEGVVTAVAPGRVTVVATALDGTGRQARATLTVAEAVPAEALAIRAPGEGWIYGEEPLTLAAEVLPAGATASVRWSVDAPGVLRIDPDTGEVEALADGAATVTARTADGDIEADIVLVVDTGFAWTAGRTITITGYTGDSATPRVPARLNGAPVTAIGPDAFRGAPIVCVELPDTIAAIGPRAFRDCAALRNITCY